MSNVPGVNGITGFVISNPEAPPFNVHGGPVDPKHQEWGETASPYPWEVVPMGPYPGLMNPIDGMVEALPDNASLNAGLLSDDPTADQTPTYHAAPFNNEGPAVKNAEQLDVQGRAAGSARQLLDSLRVHASNTGASLKKLFAPTMLAIQDDWEGFYNPEMGGDIVPAIPGSVSYQANGFGVNDHVSNAFAKVNGYSFNTAHRHRRFARGPIPGNTMWMKPGGRPMVRSFTGVHNFPTSGAFAGDDIGASFSTYGAILSEVPSEYIPPPQPVVGPAIVNADPANQSVPDVALY
jgi:hypothetical protein